MDISAIITTFIGSALSMLVAFNVWVISRLDNDVRATNQRLDGLYGIIIEMLKTKKGE